MGNRNVLIGKILAESKGTLAIQIFEKHQYKNPQMFNTFNDSKKKHYIQDTEYHITYLAEAIIADEPLLYTEYMKWVRVFFDAIKIPQEHLLENFRLISEVINEFYPNEFKLINDFHEQGIEIFNSDVAAAESFLNESYPLAKYAEEYLESLLAGRRSDAINIITNLHAGGTTVKDIYVHIFQAVQLEIGRLWQLNKISVAHEHFVTAATQLAMSQLYPHIFKSSRKNKRIVVACIAGELHEIGPRMVADFFEMEDWNSYFFGANTPKNSIIQAIQQYDPHVIALSVTMTFHIGQLKETISGIKKVPSLRDKPIIVGGYPFLIAKDLWKSTGADYCALNAEEAVSLSNKLWGKDVV